MYCWRVQVKWTAKGWGILIGGNGDHKYRFCMMWADTYWIFSHNKEKLTWMVNDIIAELMDLEMEPKHDSWWWTGTYKAEDEVTRQVGSWAKVLEMPFVEEFDLLEYRFERKGKGIQEDGGDIEERHGKLVEGCQYLSRKKCVSEDQN